MNKKSISKNHHYNPQMLLRRFVDDKGHQYYFDKRFPSKGVITGTPQNFFSETHLYTAEDKDGTKDVALETYFSKLDGRANQIIEKIVTAARKGLKPSLTDEERGQWNLSFYYQWKRVPDVFRNVPALTDFEKSLNKAIARIESRRSLTEEECRNLDDPATKKRIKQGATVGALAYPGPLVQGILSKMGIGIVIIQNPKKSFVIGSKPVLSLIPKGSNLGDPAAEVWLPVAHDVLVGPVPINPNEERIIVLEDSKIRYINEAIFQQSTAIAGRSKALISSLAGAAADL